MALHLSVMAFCLLIMVAGAANWGWSWFLLSIPCALIYGVFTWLLNHRIYQISGVALALLVCLPHGFYHAKNPILFPHIGKPFTFSCGWQLYQFRYVGSWTSAYIAYRADAEGANASLADMAVDSAKLPCGSKLALSRLRFTARDLGSAYVPVFRAENGRDITFSGLHDFDQALQQGWVQGANLARAEELQSDWSRWLDSWFL